MTKKIRLASDKNSEDALAVNKPLNQRDFLKSIGDVYEADLFPDDWSQQDIKKASGELFDRRFTSRFWGKIPNVCRRECVYWQDGSCLIGKKPEGKACPEESAFLELLMRRYMEELNVSETDMSTLSMIRDLCDIEIQLMRKAGVMARTDSIAEEPILNVRGEPSGFVRLVEHPIFRQQEGLLKRKADILKSLVATRETRLKAATDIIKDDELSKAARALKELRKRAALGNIDGAKKENFHDDFVDSTVVDDEG